MLEVMTRTLEEPLRVEETYRALLRAAVAAVGGQERAGELAKLHQTTVGRALRSEARATYSTLRKLADALPGLPDPVVPVRDADHERWCKIGAALAELKPEDFRSLLGFAERALMDGTVRPTDEQIDRLKDAIRTGVPKNLARQSRRKH